MSAIPTVVEPPPGRSRLAALLDHFANIHDPRNVQRILHPLPEVLLLVVCGTIADCDDYEDIADWGEAHLASCAGSCPTTRRSRRALADHPDEPHQPGAVCRRLRRLGARELARQGRARRHRRQDLAPKPRPQRRRGARFISSPPSPPPAAWCSARRRCPTRPTSSTAIPPLLDRLGAEDGLKGALVSIDAIATNAKVATAIAAAGRRLPARGQGQPADPARRGRGLFAEAAPADRARHTDLDKGHGRIEQRAGSVLREVDWLERPPLPGRAAPARHRLPRPRRDPVETSRHDPHRDPLLHLLPRLSPPSCAGRSAGTGRSRTACTGSSTSPSPRTSPASARATAPATWPPSATSPSTSCAPPTTGDPSSSAASAPPGPPITSTTYSSLSSANLDSWPCPKSAIRFLVPPGSVR